MKKIKNIAGSRFLYKKQEVTDADNLLACLKQQINISEIAIKKRIPITFIENGEIYRTAYKSGGIVTNVKIGNAPKMVSVSGKKIKIDIAR